MIANASEEVVNIFFKGDPRCKYKIGDFVIKNRFEKGDVHLKGSKGLVAGSYFMEASNMGSYLILFENDQAYTFTVDEKITLESEYIDEEISNS